MNEFAYVVVILFASWTSGLSPVLHTFERGSQGTIQCPAMVDNGYSADDTEAMYWSFCPKGSSDSSKRIISYYHGIITHQTSDHELYQIQNYSLVISNVNESAEGTYNYRYFPYREASQDGSVVVSESVSCKARRPKVTRCSEDQPSCEIEVPSDTTDLNLTCSVEHAKPAVNITWLRWSSVLNTWEEIDATPHFVVFTCNASVKDCFKVNNTINSSATIKPFLENNNSTFKCVTNSSNLEYVIVTVIKTGSDFLTEVTDPTTKFSSQSTRPTPSTCPGNLDDRGFLVGVLVGFITSAVVLMTWRFCRGAFVVFKRNMKPEIDPNHRKPEIEKCISLDDVTV